MQTRIDKTILPSKQQDITVKHQSNLSSFLFHDYRPEFIRQQKLCEGIENSSRTKKMTHLQETVNAGTIPHTDALYSHSSSGTNHLSMSPVVQLGKSDDEPQGRKKRQSRKLLRQINVSREQRRKKRLIQSEKERLWRKIYPHPHLQDLKYDKHAHKDARARKSGIFTDEEESENLHMSDSLESESDGSDMEVQTIAESEQTETVKKEVGTEKSEKGETEVQKKVPVNVIAEEFTRGLQEWGLHPFLSGGSAITYQGGPRPLGDLDFRITMDEGGFGSFDKTLGEELVTYINTRLLTRSRALHNDRNMAPTYAFIPMGANALTIGTLSWFGVEVSLSLVFFPPQRIIPAQSIDSENPPIDILSLKDLRADKLKSLISRRKSGEESLRKIAKDLFDFLSVCWMMQKEKEEQAEFSFIFQLIPSIAPLFPDDSLLGIFKKATILTVLLKPIPEQLPEMGAMVTKAVNGKLGEYSFVNHDGHRWTGAPPDTTREIMRARAILTARAHLIVGARIKAFSDLIEEIALHVRKSGDTNMLSLLKAMPEMLRNISHLRIDPYLQKSLQPWFAEWNQFPTFAPPPLFKRLVGPIWKPDTATVALSAGQIIEESDSELEVRMEAYQPQLSSDERIVLKILVAHNGFCMLLNGYTATDVLRIFAMTRKKFEAAWKELAKKGLVQPQPDGLHLTEAGKAEFL